MLVRVLLMCLFITISSATGNTHKQNNGSDSSVSISSLDTCAIKNKNSVLPQSDTLAQKVLELKEDITKIDKETAFWVKKIKVQFCK